MKRFVISLVLPSFLVILWVALPLIRGSHTLFLRDVFNTHLSKKWVQAEAMRDGTLPIIDPYRDGGQPHLGNPNTVPLYPDNLLYLVASTFWAFNAHFWLHLLLAPLSMFWMARAWGLSRPAAWTAGLCYTASGFFVSNLGFYNLIAGAAWTPAFVAALLRAARAEADRRTLLPVGLIWTLLMLAGDPMSCLTALLLGSSAVLLREGWQRPRWIRLGSALALGSAIASPQWVEFLRILPLSYRGHMGFSEAAAMAASWHPLAVIEWFVPFFFGQPNLAFWGQQIHGGNLPLFPSLYPGALALLLVLGSGWPKRRPALWAWAVSALGIFLALGEHNPVVRLLLEIPGSDLMRLPVKFWLMTAVGLSLLCGLGFARLFEEGNRRLLWRLCAILGLIYILLWLGFGGAGAGGPAWLAERLAPSLDSARLQIEQTAWAGWALISLALVILIGVVHRLAGRSSGLAGAGLVVVHLVVQLWILRPALPMAEIDLFSQPPELLSYVEEERIVTHGKANRLFGASEVPASEFPDARAVWLQRQVFDELYPVAGTIWGRRYDFSISAEGLDGFLTRAAAEALRVLSDEARVRLLAASGVEILLLGRPLDGTAQDLVELRHRRVGEAGETWVYRIDAAPRAQLLGRVLRAPHLNAALQWMTSSRFDATSTVVLPEGGASLDGPAGRVEIVASSPQRVEMRTSSSAPGVVLLQRAFLPIYRARADGQRVSIVAANIHRLGIEVPAGEHRVEVWIDARPLWISGVVALLALLALILISVERRHA